MKCLKYEKIGKESPTLHPLLGYSIKKNLHERDDHKTIISHVRNTYALREYRNLTRDF